MVGIEFDSLTIRRRIRHKMDGKIQNIHQLIDKLETGISDDVMVFQDIFCDVISSQMDVMLSFKHGLFVKIQEMVCGVKALKLELETAKKQLSVKDEELKGLKSCSKCHNLEKQLSVLKKKQAVNESRIKSIARILSRQTPGTQFTEIVDAHEDEDSDQSSVTKAYNLVSQVLGHDDNYTGSETQLDELEIERKVGFVKVPHSPRKARITYSKKSPKAVKNEQLKKSDELLVCPFNGTDKENKGESNSPSNKEESNSPSNKEEFKSPTKEHVPIISLESPVLGKSKKTPLKSGGITPPVIRDAEPALEMGQELDYENMYWIPASPDTSRPKRKKTITPLSPGQRKGKEPEKKIEVINSNKNKPCITNGGKRKADFWRLSTTPFVDPNTLVKKQGTKLKQAKLSLGCFPKKVDICDIKEFNGGIRPSQTSTQITRRDGDPEDIDNFKKPVALRNNLKFDDIVMDSPQAASSKNKRKGRLYNEGKKQCDKKLFSAATNEDLVISAQMSGDDQALSKRALQSEEEVDSSFDSIKKPSSSPKYKYRDGPVRKKIERQKLPGWDCDNCRKYYEAAGGRNASEEEIKAIMNRCSKHRDKNPIRSRTPPGFWDADFPPTPDCKNLNTTYMDVLPALKKRKN